MKRRKVQETRTKNLKPQKKNGSTEHGVIRTHPQHVCTCGFERIFPWWFPGVVFMVTVLVRIHYVYQPKNWWVLHPDEVFQSVEVAHSDVYGYGFYPYEYQGPPVNVSTDAEKQQIKMGMYAMRSFLYPRAFTIVMEIAHRLDLSLSPFMVCRLFNVFVTSTLPLAVFWFTRKLYICHVISCLACVLTASSLHLMVFGTHCLVNSFTAPILFFGLYLCFYDSNGFLQETRYEDMNKNVSKSLHRREVTVTTSVICKDLNTFDGTKTTANTSSPEAKELKYDKICNGTNEHLYCEHKVMNANPSSYTIEDTMGTGRISEYYQIRTLGSGFLIGLACYIRLDNLLFSGVVFVSVLYVDVISNSLIPRSRIMELVYITFGGLLAVCFGISYDSWTYGQFIIPPLQWLRFNLFSNGASVLFGTKGVSVYTKVFSPNRFYDLMNVSGLLLLSYYYMSRKKISIRLCVSLALLAGFLVILFGYTLIGHKEPRLLHNLVVLHLIIISHAVHVILKFANNHNVNEWKITTGVVLFVTVFCLNSYQNFPSASDSSASNWTYKNATTSRDVNICLELISKMKDVRGVMLDESIYHTHGYSILRHDVPMLSKIHHEYYLYTIKRDNTLHFRRSIRVLNRYSDYIYEHNSHYLSRLIAKTNTFNYVITKRPKFFHSMQYFEVFKSGVQVVLLRNLTEHYEEKLNKFADNLPLGTNATILEYEVGWLLTAGLYDLAVERAKQSLELDSSRVRIFQLLMVAYGRTHKWKEVRKIQQECFTLHSQEKCESHQEKVVLHGEYKQFESINP